MGRTKNAKGSQAALRQKRPPNAVYRGLRADIIRGAIPPGRRMTEEGLATQFGVSRTPVREAVQRLETEGLLERTPYYGITVRQMAPKEIEDVYIVRSDLEGLAARLAARTMSDQEQTKLNVLHDKLDQAVASGDVDLLASLNYQFHGAILKATGNDALEAIMHDIHVRLARLQRSTLGYPGRAERALAEHRALLDALLDRDAERAGRLARAHIDNALQVRLLMHVDQETLEGSEP